MKAELTLSPELVDQISDKVIEKLKPVISSINKDNDDVILDVSGLAKYLGVSETWIYERTHFKEIPHLKIKGHLRFRKKDIDKWLNSCSVPPVNTPGQVLKAMRR